MHTFVARVISAAVAATTLALPAASLASGGVIRFTGAITENSCTVSVQDGDSNDQPVADGAFFHVALSDCTAGQADRSGTRTGTGTGTVEVRIVQISARAFTLSLIYP